MAGVKEANFVERRKENRLPFKDKVIFTDGHKSATAHSVNISRGGIFAVSMDPYPIDTQVMLAFMLPSQSASFCVKAKVAHIVFDRQRCEVECGMGIMFLDLTDAQKSILNLHILNEQTAYLELKKVLANPKPDPALLQKYLKRIPSLQEPDILGLRYRVNRICTIFEPAPSVGAEAARRSA